MIIAPLLPDERQRRGGASCRSPASAITSCPSSWPQYSFSLTTFSPSGKLVQIEYALAAVAAGATSLGITATDGVVIATEKKLPSVLVDEGTVQKISTLTPNIGVVYSGMGPDYRVLVRKARKTAQAYFRLYQEHIPVAQLVREVAAVMQEFTRGCCPGAAAHERDQAAGGSDRPSPICAHARGWACIPPHHPHTHAHTPCPRCPSPACRIRRGAALWRVAAAGGV